MSTKEEHEKRIGRLYSNYYNKMVSYAFSFTKNKNDAEDLIQDIMIELLKKENKKIWNEKESITFTYIIKMIQSRAFNYLKKYKTKNNTEVDLTENEEIVVDDYDYVADNLEERLLNAYIETINESKKQKELIYANYYVKVKLYKMKVSQVAKMAKVSQNTVYKKFKIIDAWVEENFAIKKEKIMNDLFI